MKHKSQCSALAMGLALCLGTALAQEYPNKPIRAIIGNSAGSPADVVARMMSPDMAQILGQPIVVENRVGASSAIGYEFVAKQPPDGYTISVVQVPALAILPATVANLRFDPVKDLPPVIGLAEGRFVLVSASSQPWKTVPEMVAAVKAVPPGKMGYGSPSHLVRLPVEGMLRSLGLTLTHVPYSAAAPYYQGIVVGETQMGLVAESTAAGFGDKLRVLAVTGTRRSPALPAVPTFAELGIPGIPGLRYSLNATSGTPKPIIDKLHSATANVLQRPEIRARFAKLQMDVLGNSPEAEAKELVDMARFLSDTAKAIGIKPE